MKFEPQLHRLPNGLTVILDPMDAETVSFCVLFCTGSRDESPTEYGLTHFCEHMLCKGTPRFPDKKSVDDYFDYYSGTRNAATGNRHLKFYGRILAENTDKLVDYIGDQLQNSVFDPKKIEIEHDVVCDELRRALDNPFRQYDDFTSRELFNYATFSTRNLGTIESIKSFNRDTIIEFLSRRLSAKNCIICASGKIDNPDRLLKYIEKTFAFLPSIDVPENDSIEYTPKIAHNSQPDKQNVKMRILFTNKCGYGYDDLYQNHCVGFFERYITRELNNIIRHENGLVYGFGSIGFGNEKFSVNGFATETATKNIEKCVALIAKNAYRIYTENKITDDDIDKMKRSAKLGRADFIESSGQRCGRLIGFYRDYGRLYDFYKLTKLYDSATADDVIKYSRGYFDGPISILTQGADFDTDLGAVWRENFK